MKVHGFLGIFLALIIIAAVGSTLFYWYEYRPSNIRKDCYQVIMKIRDERINTENRLGNFEGNNLYRRCLIEHGMEAEDMVKSYETR